MEFRTTWGVWGQPKLPKRTNRSANYMRLFSAVRTKGPYKTANGQLSVISAHTHLQLAANLQNHHLAQIHSVLSSSKASLWVWGTSPVKGNTVNLTESRSLGKNLWQQAYEELSRLASRLAVTDYLDETKRGEKTHSQVGAAFQVWGPRLHKRDSLAKPSILPSHYGLYP